MSLGNTAAERYERARLRYINCTYLHGNLELVGLNYDGTNDLTFLENIREITGYVYVYRVHFHVIPLTSLRIIGGYSLVDLGDGEHRVSLYVGESSARELQLPNLIGKQLPYYIFLLW